MHRFRLSFQCLTLLLSLAAQSPLCGDEPTRTPLTTAHQVRALGEEVARSEVPVRIVGVVMGRADPEGIAFVIHDGAEGIYVQAPADLVAGLERGQLVEIQGVTDPGGYAPYVVADHLKVVGQRRIPEPTPATLHNLYAGQMDAQWVEVTGIVRSVKPIAPTDAAPLPPGTRFKPRTKRKALDEARVYKLKLAYGDTRVMVEVTGPLDPDALVDAEVRLRALCFNLHNRNRQFVKPFLQMPAGVSPEIVAPPPSDTLEQKPRSIASLLQFGSESGRYGHRVHLRGIVVHHQPGAYLWLRDGQACLRVETEQDEVLQPGDQVDVLGFPHPGEYSPVLQDAMFRRTAHLPVPQPTVLDTVSDALRNDANLVQLQARLTEVRQFPESAELTLEWHDTPIRAILHTPDGKPYPASWETGSIVNVRGICEVVADEPGPLGGLWIPRRFTLLLRSPDDLTVLHPPPWWNAERIVWLLSGFLLIALGTIAVVMWISRQRLKEQMHRRSMAETEFSAILRERNRLAREIHDTLSQSLGAISVQLELARTHANEMSDPMRANLAAAHKMTRDALAEARNSIWNMRSQVLEGCDLSEALERILRQLTADQDVTTSVQVVGEKRRLSPLVENNLLRIGQEAINNALKHAEASTINVSLEFDHRQVSLSVEDDGTGFTDTAPSDNGRQSYGLLGIRERANLLDGEVHIESGPQRGTRVVVRIVD
ncbi:MAG: histidine kinase [Puniceicoccaceae bacterium 5H]|nr:MAG: histidine kinase [Puniceicoccaceae bacterium 5H]